MCALFVQKGALIGVDAEWRLPVCNDNWEERCSVVLVGTERVCEKYVRYLQDGSPTTSSVRCCLPAGHVGAA